MIGLLVSVGKCCVNAVRVLQSVLQFDSCPVAIGNGFVARGIRNRLLPTDKPREDSKKKKKK